MASITKISFVTFLLLVLADIAFALPSPAVLGSGASIEVSMISQNPDPVAPGSYAELRWMVANKGTAPLEDVEFRLLPNYPVELLGLDTGVRSLGTIQGWQEGEEGVILYYRVRIAEDAPDGTDKLTLVYRFRGTESWVKLGDFDLRVRSSFPAVTIDEVSVKPQMIPPGNIGRISLQLTNLASSTMKDLTVKLDLTLSNIPRSATGAESSMLFDVLPFTPVGSSDEKRISSLSPGKSANINFDIMVYPSAASKVYKLPIVLTYKDDLGNVTTRNEIIGIIVGASPDIYAVIDKSDIVAGQKSGTISFKFVNRGVTDIKFLDVVLKDNEDFTVVSSNEEYIGNVNSDDFENADFSLYLSNNINKDKNSVIHFPLHISFKDANNVDYTQDINLTYRIFTAEEKGLAKSNRMSLIIIIVVLMLVALFLYRRWEKKRSKRSE